MTDKEKRDFLLKEIQKRIVGPGFTEEVYVCKLDASDEILVNRPQQVYTSGILFPKEPMLLGDDSDTSIDEKVQPEDETTESVDLEMNEEASDSQQNYSDTKVEDVDDTDDTSEDKLPNEDDTNQFKPNHIGLITCLNTSAQNIQVEINYGKYENVKNQNIEKDIHVKLGRCTVEQLKSTFDYYDKYARDLLKQIGKESVWDMFSLDEEKKYISPKSLFEIQRSNSTGKRYLRPSDFPSLLRNKVASLLRLLSEHTKEVNIKKFSISIEDLNSQLSEISKIPELEPILDANKITDFNKAITYNPDECTINIKEGFDWKGIRIAEFIYVDDPVKDFILEKLLQFRFFKRKQYTETVKISLNNSEKEINDDLALYWKVIPSRHNTNQKYLRIHLQNRHERSGQTSLSEFIFQAELKVISPDVVSYTEPHRSAVDDGEYELNEVLYSDELVYAKGVNCAATWDNSNDYPGWVKTTYMPTKKVRSFSTESDNEAVNQACIIHDMTIWSKFSKQDIINRFKKLPEAYAKWQEEQRALDSKNKNILNPILKDQEEFCQRLKENIEYLEQNDKAYKCFQLANTSMYIQMVLARDPRFEKGRTPDSYEANSDFYNKDAWEYLSDNKTNVKPCYRPFQLAFLLMNIKSVFEYKDSDRNDIVDLIWFPTGGGKTEAYLALTALTIAERRNSDYENVKGVSVIMRYTLRLLTAQQFERASFLICSMEYLRNQLKERKEDYSLGDDEISIGMWIGKASTPNKKEDLAKGKYQKFFEIINGNKKHNIEPRVPEANENPFPVSYCPWCGCNMLGIKNQMILTGYNKEEGNINCVYRKCIFKDKLPIYYIDEVLYNNPPTLLFATVDKFAQLTSKTAGKLFGIETNRRKPDLIIQDELHLISGPLGSIVGMFETMVEELCTERDSQGNVLRKPKIIASTATTRNTKQLIKQLYNREVKTFPVSGVRYNNNFFSIIQEESKRLYAGFAPTGHTAAELEIHVIAAELVAKEKLIRNILKENDIDPMNKQAVIDFLFKDGRLQNDVDNYWTTVIYYKDLKSLGRTRSRIGQEIFANANMFRSFTNTYPSLDFILKDFPYRANEFTSRQESSKIKQLLAEAEGRTKFEDGRITSQMDIVQATNMISVGIDIARWNVMLMIGQPLTTAEYIQASSRVGRKYDGLIINLFNPHRNRELSLYENYEPYHQVFYKYVEPLSATTFTEMTLDKLLANLYLCYMVLIKKRSTPSDVTDNDIKEFKNLLNSRCHDTGSLYTNLDIYMNTRIDQINKFFKDATRENKQFHEITKDNSSDLIEHQLDFTLMRSLRDVESNTYILYE